MTGAGVSWTLAEVGRLLWAHGVDSALAAGALDIGLDEAQRLVAGEPLAVTMTEERRTRAALLLNILARIELRCGHDPVAIRAALDRPLDTLGAVSIAERLRDQPDDLDGLRALRALRGAAGTMPVPKIRTWRVADRYS
ncbi:hypothetical protein [Sphingomonas melonis]|uniref:Uncharacterized protein n=1 Tax=Sphingomonas melonis TaxID=152682 RepID=A0A7Y9FQI0_9SPHN|nr:hypothetical protein [Sphingomonas melonis]NYD91613.1 hypothetical protein [Sphingomonas melonis]